MYQEKFKSTVTDDLIKKWEIKSNTSDYNLDRIKYEINLGNEGKGGINLKPFYQREYKFTRKDESLLIESLLGGIPIPVIYLASDTSIVPHVSNVIDGQHRLMAVYRFLTNKFSLTGLKKYTELENLYFNDLHSSIKNKLLYQISLTLEFIHVQDDPELELEIFTRYNQGTNPLTSQEIRHVVFSSSFNDWLCNKLNDWYKETYMKDIFNMSASRFGDKTIHQEFYVLLAIYKNIISPNYAVKDLKKYQKIVLGINQDYYNSPSYVTEFMSYCRNLSDIDTKGLIHECEMFMCKFIHFLREVFYKNGLRYPLSKEIFQGERTVRNYKMQTSILMIMTSVYYWIMDNNIDYTTEKSKELLRMSIANGFCTSEFPNTKSSTTEPKFLVRTISNIIDVLNKELK